MISSGTWKQEETERGVRKSPAAIKSLIQLPLGLLLSLISHGAKLCSVWEFFTNQSPGKDALPALDKRDKQRMRFGS